MNLREHRSRLGWSQRRLAVESGVSIPTIERIERDGSYDPRISRVTRLARALQVTVDDLCFTHDPEPHTGLNGRGTSQNQQPDEGASGANQSPRPAPHGG